MVEGEGEHENRGDDFDDEEDAGVIWCVIVVEPHLVDVADSISEEPDAVGDYGCQPEVSANPETQNSEDTDGEIGHADLVFVGAGGPTDGGGGLLGTEDVGVGSK